MKICDNGHDEVAYCHGLCPACLEKAKKEVTDQELCRWKCEVDEIRQEVRDLKASIHTLKFPLE